MKTIYILLTVILSCSLHAQQTLDTLYANNQNTVAVFFPEAIKQAITGASHFVFTYNRETKQYFGLLQAQQGKTSNLLVVTDDGQVYSYILKYAKKLSKLNYFISKTKSIGNEFPAPLMERSKRRILDSVARSVENYKNFCKYLLKVKLRSLAKKQKHGVGIRLQKLVYHNSKIYLVMEVSNNSGIAFEIDFLEVYRRSGYVKRKASHQRLEMKPIYSFNMPNEIKNGQSLRFIYVLPKFVLTSKEKLEMELQELNGSRKVLLVTKV